MIIKSTPYGYFTFFFTMEAYLFLSLFSCYKSVDVVLEQHSILFKMKKLSSDRIL
jgi:hypothetical protein